MYSACANTHLAASPQVLDSSPTHRPASSLSDCHSVRAPGGPALRSIFINYRRSDSEGEAGHLFDELSARFGANSVFMDVAAIEPGRDFRKAIDHSVSTCSVVLALIGQSWLAPSGAGGARRLDDPNDFVRIELASALRRDIPVIPVLVRGARMPQPDQLPDDLKELAFRNAVELTHARWKSDVQVLIQSLLPFEEPPSTATSSPAQSPPAPLAASAFDTATIDRVRKELALYIGPIAEVVIKRATKRCASLDELCNSAAQEIESEPDRAKFLRSCRG